jgi:hypothetical protein
MNESDRRDRRRRWIVVLGMLGATQILGFAVSLSQGFWDIWLGS